MEYKHEVIMCVVNAGFAEAVMDAAREHGARGGTVLHARGTANPEAEKHFNIPIQPDKEIVMIIVEHDIRDQIMHNLYQKVGLQTAGQGIAFCLPVDDVVGLSTAQFSLVPKPQVEKKEEPAPESSEQPQEEQSEPVQADEKEQPNE